MSSQRHSELGESLRLNKQLIDEGRSLAAENTQLRELNAGMLVLLREARDTFRDAGDRTWGGLAWRIDYIIAKAEKLK